MTTLLDRALEYAELGWPVFPCGPASKAPITPHGFKDASTDEAVIRAWWKRWPDANVAVATGWAVDVVDFDTEESLDLIPQWGLIGPTVKTSKGAHVYIEGGLASRPRFVPGVDYKGVGGYVIAPPSGHPDGAIYEWVMRADEPLRPPSAGLLAALARPTPPVQLPLTGVSLEGGPQAAPSTAIPAGSPQRPLEGRMRPGDAYSQTGDHVALLEAHGWRRTAVVGRDGNERWQRPGKEAGGGHSATWHEGRRVLYVFTSASNLEPGKGYSLFDLLAVWEHGGDHSSAARVLRSGPVDVRHVVDEGGDDVVPPAKVIDWPVMGDEAYAGLAGDVVRCLADHTESDAAGLLVSLLVAYGCMVGNGPHLLLSGQRHHARLFAVLVGDSAMARKGSATSMVKWFLRMVDPGFVDTRWMGGVSSGEGLLEEVRDPVWVQDKMVAGSLDRRLLVVEPEFAGRLLRTQRRDGNTLSATIRQAWDSGDLRLMTRKNPLRATNAHISIIGHSTLAELRAEGRPTDDLNGFTNRFLHVLVRSDKLLPFGSSPDPHAVAVLARRVGRALASVVGNGDVATWAAEARDRWVATYSSLRGEPAGSESGSAARGDVQVQRLALTYALLDGQPLISSGHLASAMAVWTYCRRSLELIVHGDVGLWKTGSADADRILEHLAGERDWVRSRFFRVEWGWGGARLSGAVGVLERARLVELGSVATGGRPSMALRVRV